MKKTLRCIDRASYYNWKLYIYHTNLCTILQYHYFTPIRISALRMPSSGGHTVISTDYTSIVLLKAQTIHRLYKMLHPYE
jgi:hypothetical protein